MKTIKGRVILIGGAVLVIGAVILIILLSNSEATYRSISISEVFGKVITQNNGKSYEAYKNMVISGGYSLSTEKESYTRMVLDGDKYMKLEEESSASFVSLGSPQSKKTAIRLNYGALSTEITQPLAVDEDFVVNTPNAVLAVRGTFFRAVVSFDTNGDAYTDVYTYGGAIDCHRVMPDGTEVDEHVIIDKGYKARIKMDEIITVYVEELIEEEKDDVDPLEIQEVQDDQLVDVYNASAHGHEMFLTVKELWLEILERDIDLSKYNSAYDGGEIPEFTDEGVNTSEPESSDLAEETTKPVETTKVEETTKPEETTEAVTSTAEEQSGTLPFETAEPTPEAVPNNNGGHSGVPPNETAEPPPDGTAQSPPDETAEQLPQVTPDETEKPPPEVITETTSMPARPPDGTGDSAATDEVYDPPESTDEVVEPTESTDEVVEPTETTTSGSEPIPDEPDLIAIDEVNFPDDVFRTYVSENFDGDMDGYLSKAECEAVTNIDVGGTSSEDGGVTSLKGVEHFTKLETLYCDYNSGITELDVSKNTALKDLRCGNTQISELDVSKNTALTDLDFRSTLIDAIDVSNNTALKELSCIGTSISTLDVSKNTELIVLWCSDTSISTLDLSKNTALHYLSFSDTLIKEIDLSKNTELIHLYCYNSPISKLDVSNNTELVELQCYRSNLAYIDTSNNAITSFSAYGNKHPITIENGDFDISSISGIDLSRIVNKEVTLKSADNTSATATIDGSGRISGITKDVTEITYIYDCDGTGGHNVTFTLVPDEDSTFVFEPVEINDVNFPDAVFRQHVLDYYDTDNDNILSKAECEAVTQIFVGGDSSTEDGGITSLKGIEHFNKLIELYCYCNNGLTELDVSRNTALITLDFFDTSISEIDVSKNTELNYLSCFNTPISALDVSKNTALTRFYCSGTPIRTLDISNNTNLQELLCYGTRITELDVSKNAALEYLDCSETSISELDVSKNMALKTLSCRKAPISELDLSNNTALKYLSLEKSSINALDLSKNSALTTLYCDNTPITKLDVSKNTALERLFCRGTLITELDVSKNTVLEYLQCNDANLAFIDLSNNSEIDSQFFIARDNKHFITVTNGKFDTKTIFGFKPSRVSNVVGAEWDGSTGILSNIAKGTTEITYTYDCDGKGTNNVTFTLVPDENSTYYFEPVEINDANFPDPIFRQYVMNHFDKDSDDTLSEAECEAVTEINVNGASTTDDGGITSLKGVENFTKLTKLYCSCNSGLTGLDISKNTALTDLICLNTSISTLDVSKNTALENLWCSSTKITALDVSKNTALRILRCCDIQISSLDVSKNTALKRLECWDTQISALDISNNTALVSLSCYNTHIGELDVGKNTALNTLRCFNTQISALDVSKNTALTYLECRNANLAFINTSNNNAITTFLSGENNHPITITNGTFKTKTIPGFDPARVSNVSGAEWNASTGVLSNIAEGTTEITYTYDCDGNHGHDVMFTLVPDDASTYVSNLSINTLSLDNAGEGLTDNEANPEVDVNVPSSDVETPSDIASEENSENVSEVVEEVTEQKGEKIPEPPPDVDDLLESETDEALTESESDETLTESAVDEVLTETTGDEILTENTGDEVLTETAGDETLTENAGDEVLTETTGDETLTESTADNGGEDLTESTTDGSAENLNTVNDSAESGSEVITDLEPNFTPETVTQMLTDAA